MWHILIGSDNSAAKAQSRATLAVRRVDQIPGGLTVGLTLIARHCVNRCSMLRVSAVELVS
jgi:hypothetical protein